MADFFCSFLDFRSPTTNYNLPLFLPSRHYCSSACQSHNSRISRIRRRPFHLTLLCKPSSSEFDLISTHEHSDGSLLFQFGDPSEFAKNVKVGESKTAKEEIEGEGGNGYNVVKVVEGDNETEVMTKKADREVSGSSLTEVVDGTNSIVSSSNSVTVVGGASESCEKLLEGSGDTELPVLTSSKEMESISTPHVDIEQIENVEGGLNEEYEDSNPASVLGESSRAEYNIATSELSEKMTAEVTSKEMEVASAPGVDIEHSGNAEESVNEENEDSPVDASILDESSEVVSNITTAALSEKETADITLIPNIDIEHVGNVEESLDEEYEGSSTANDSIPDKNPKVEDNTTAPDLLEKETAEVASMTGPTVAVPENDTRHGSLETVGTTDVSPTSEHQNVEIEMKNETIEDGRESFNNNLVSPSPQSEPAISLSKQIEEQNFQAEAQKAAFGKGSESDMNDIKALEKQNVIGNGSASDASDAEAKSPPMEAAMNWSIGPEDQASGAGSGMRVKAGPMLEEAASIGTVEGFREDDGSQNLTVDGDLVEASVHEVTLTASTPISQEIPIANFVLSSGAALLPHPSKALTGGEDAYFIAGQTWLGVADGVGQWSLEGTHPGVYAQELIKNCEKLISDRNGDSINNPVELLNLSVAKTHSPGSSTVLIAQFDGQALHVANVGDSGFIVLRHGVVYKRSSPMHHVFHFPLQIERGDDPSSLAELYRVDLEEEDVIITATDGLLDNLYDQEISSIVVKSLAADKSPEEIAGLLTRKAQDIGSLASVRSPFADDAQAAGFAGYTGGKLDDVAVIVSVVKRQSNSQTL